MQHIRATLGDFVQLRSPSTQRAHGASATIKGLRARGDGGSGGEGGDAEAEAEADTSVGEGADDLLQTLRQLPSLRRWFITAVRCPVAVVSA